MQFVAKRTPPVPASLDEVTITLTGPEAKAIFNHIYKRIPQTLVGGYDKTPEFQALYEHLRIICQA